MIYILFFMYLIRLHRGGEEGRGGRGGKPISCYPIQQTWYNIATSDTSKRLLRTIFLNYGWLIWFHNIIKKYSGQKISIKKMHAYSVTLWLCAVYFNVHPKRMHFKVVWFVSSLVANNNAKNRNTGTFMGLCRMIFVLFFYFKHFSLYTILYITSYHFIKTT